MNKTTTWPLARIWLATLTLLAFTACDSGDTLKDARDGKTYKTVKIGGQVWMAENLNFEAEGSKCYDNKPENCAKYGRLYNWETAMKACPAGWHLPAKEEWDALTATVGGENTEGKKLKAKEGWNDNNGISVNGTDEFGFAALPGGSGDSDGSFYSIGSDGCWWSSSESSDGFDDGESGAYRRTYYNEYALWDNSGMTYLFSVRCIKD